MSNVCDYTQTKIRVTTHIHVDQIADNFKTKVRRMQRSGTEAIRTQTKPSKPKREITKITNSQNTERTHSQPSEQLFPKRWPLSNRNRTKNNMNTFKVKRRRNSDTKNRQEPQQNYRIGTVSNELLGGGGLKLVVRAQPHPKFLKWYKTFSWLFSSHDNPLTRQ